MAWELKKYRHKVMVFPVQFSGKPYVESKGWAVLLWIIVDRPEEKILCGIILPKFPDSLHTSSLTNATKIL